MQDLQPRLVARAIEIAGDEDELCRRLGVEQHALRLWLDGRAPAPPRVLHDVIDLILEDDLARAAQDRRRRPRSQARGGT